MITIRKRTTCEKCGAFYAPGYQLNNIKCIVCGEKLNDNAF